MPELPEVETIKRGLEKRILNKKITEVKIASPKVIKEPSAGEFRKGLIGEKPQEIIRQGKALIIKLRENKFLFLHLRIAGWILYGEEEDKARVVFKFSDKQCLNYMDQRLLGELRLKKDFRGLKFIKELGADPLKIGLKEFQEIVKKKKISIKILLMDQKILAGIGNIYAQESLFRAKISPLRNSSSLTLKEISILHKELQGILKEAVKYQGSSVDSYRLIDGASGGMGKRLKVYGRKNQPCFICGSPVKKIDLGGRGTCFCPKCQK